MHFTKPFAQSLTSCKKIIRLFCRVHLIVLQIVLMDVTWNGDKFFITIFNSNFSNYPWSSSYRWVCLFVCLKFWLRLLNYVFIWQVWFIIIHCVVFYSVEAKCLLLEAEGKEATVKSPGWPDGYSKYVNTRIWLNFIFPACIATDQ